MRLRGTDGTQLRCQKVNGAGFPTGEENSVADKDDDSTEKYATYVKNRLIRPNTPITALTGRGKPTVVKAVFLIHELKHFQGKGKDIDEDFEAEFREIREKCHLPDL